MSVLAGAFTVVHGMNGSAAQLLPPSRGNYNLKNHFLFFSPLALFETP